MSFGVIVNQVPSDIVGDMYNDLAKDNFRSMFDGLSIPGFTFDINIDSVIMLSYDELGLEQNRFRDTLAEEILKHPAAAIKLENEISFCNNDLKRYHISLLGTVEEAFSESALVAFTNGFTGVVSGTIQNRTAKLPTTKIGSQINNINPYYFAACYSSMETPPANCPAGIMIGNSGVGNARNFLSGVRFPRAFTEDVHKDEVQLHGQLLLLGNAGACKSTLLAQLGGKLDSGAKFHRGFTKDISEELVKVHGEDVRLIDVLDCWGPHPGFTFDINIDSVIMLPFNELELEQNKFRDTLAEEILKHPAAAIKLENEILFCNNDLKRYQTALLNRVGRAILSSRPLMGSVNREIFKSYLHVAQKATKAMARTVVN
ncbi:hypothetical protein CPC16_004644 [Podila verticillata]|nr:hypothetical protein CPC16_004644 [Podila verticillata]